MPRSEYRSDYSPPAPSRRGGATRVTEYEDDIEIRERRDRRPPRERDYLRDAYERGSDRNGELVVREEIDERSTRGGRRDKDRREDEEVVIIRSGDKRRERPRRREVIDEEEDVRIRERDRDGSVSERISIDEEIVKGRRRERPVEREEIREEVVYRPRRERPYEREEITEEWIHIPRERPPVAREVEEWRFGPPKRRSRSENYERIIIKDRERERPREEVREEEVDIRERDRRGPSRDYRESEITIRERDRDRDRDRPRDRSREEDISIREKERDDRGSDSRDEEIRITERDRKGGPVYRDEEIRIREREHESEWRERTRGSDRDDARASTVAGSPRRENRDEVREEITIKREERDGPGGRTDELIIRRKERSPSPEPIPVPAPAPPPPEPEIIRAPPIHQEIITHHRHIDHGYEPYQPPASAPARIRTPSPPSPETPPKSTFEEIAIRHRDVDGRHEDDIVIKQKSREEPRPVAPRRRSLSIDGRSTVSREVEVERRRFVGERPPTSSMWTEITKDLVVKEAIERFGYEYEETEWFYYVMEYLRAEDVRRLVKASDDIRARRRERIRQIERESQLPRDIERFSPRPAIAERSWEEERIVEREYYGPRPPRPVILPRPLSPPVVAPRVIERDKIVVIRNER